MARNAGQWQRTEGGKVTRVSRVERNWRGVCLSLRRRAYHQAGYAFMARFESIVVREVSTRLELGSGKVFYDSGGQLSFDGFDGLGIDGPGNSGKEQKVVRIMLAAHLAERLAISRRATVPPCRRRDLEAWEVLARVVMGGHPSATRLAWMEFQWLQVRDILCQNWATIEAIAEALIERETLSGKGVDEIRQSCRERECSRLQVALP